MGMKQMLFVLLYGPLKDASMIIRHIKAPSQLPIWKDTTPSKHLKSFWRAWALRTVIQWCRALQWFAFMCTFLAHCLSITRTLGHPLEIDKYLRLYLCLPQTLSPPLCNSFIWTFSFFKESSKWILEGNGPRVRHYVVEVHLHDRLGL